MYIKNPGVFTASMVALTLMFAGLVLGNKYHWITVDVQRGLAFMLLMGIIGSIVVCIRDYKRQWQVLATALIGSLVGPGSIMWFFHPMSLDQGAGVIVVASAVAFAAIFGLLLFAAVDKEELIA